MSKRHCSGTFLRETPKEAPGLKFGHVDAALCPKVIYGEQVLIMIFFLLLNWYYNTLFAKKIMREKK